MLCRLLSEGIYLLFPVSIFFQKRFPVFTMTDFISPIYYDISEEELNQNIYTQTEIS